MNDVVIMTAFNPIVSIIMPAYNTADTIGAAIESVLAQTFSSFELIICDDASSDTTSRIVKGYGDQRIRLFCNVKNLGAGRSRDRAISLASGQWIALLDADDAWISERLEILMAIAVEHPSAIVFDELVLCHDTAGGLKPWRPTRSNHAFGRVITSPEPIGFSEFIGAKRTVMQPVIPLSLVRRHNVRHSGKQFSEDLEFFLTLIAHGAELWYVPKAMYLYRVNPIGMSSVSGRDEMLLETLSDALEKFSDDSKKLDAIRNKISSVQRAQEYNAFLSRLRQGHFWSALKRSIRHPWVISELVRRSKESVPYHVSRAFHRGSRRLPR